MVSEGPGIVTTLPVAVVVGLAAVAAGFAYVIRRLAARHDCHVLGRRTRPALRYRSRPRLRRGGRLPRRHRRMTGGATLRATTTGPRGRLRRATRRRSSRRRVAGGVTRERHRLAAVLGTRECDVRRRPPAVDTDDLGALRPARLETGRACGPSHRLASVDRVIRRTRTVVGSPSAVRSGRPATDDSEDGFSAGFATSRSDARQNVR